MRGTARRKSYLGDRERATSLLHQAIDQGENRLEYTTDCAEFAILQGTVGWLAALKRLGATELQARERDA